MVDGTRFLKEARVMQKLLEWWSVHQIVGERVLSELERPARRLSHVCLKTQSQCNLKQYWELSLPRRSISIGLGAADVVAVCLDGAVSARDVGLVVSTTCGIIELAYGR